MALTTHEKIRKFAAFQSVFIRQAFRNEPGASVISFFVDSDDNVKFVPEFNTGATIAGVSDVAVWLGLSGVYGTSRLGVASIDIDQGSVTLAAVPPVGSSLVISYSSSAIPDWEVEQARKEGEAYVNQRLSSCYDLPLSVEVPSVTSMATRLSAALLLIRGYGTGARDTSMDGYKLYEQLMGSNQRISQGTGSEVTEVGEIGLICSPGAWLVDEGGNIVPRNDAGNVAGSDTFVSGGRVRGRAFDPTEEAWRFKPWQEDVNRDQPGSGR